MPPKINNLVELNQYLEELENRIIDLEMEIEILKKKKPVKNTTVEYLKEEKRKKNQKNLIVFIIEFTVICTIALYIWNLIT